MLATISSSLSAGLLDAIKNIFKTVTNLPNIFAMLLQSALALVYSLMYYTFMSIAVSVNFFEALFKKFAGIDPMRTNEGKYQDIITIFIGSDEVWGLFVSILVLSIVLLMLFTFIAIIKSEFSLDVKGSAKGPIIARSLKALAMLIIVPAVSVMGIYATNAITQTINGMFRNGDDVPLSNQVFYIAAYGANRARIDGQFKNYIAGKTVSGLWDKYSLPDSCKNRDGGTFNNPDSVAYEIDIAFRAGRKAQGDRWIMLDIVSQSDVGFQQDIMFTTIPWIYLADSFNPWNAATVSYYYSLANFDYTIGITATVYLTILLLFMVFSLIKRVFEIVILLLLAPPLVAMSPLDNGSATKKWATEFMKRVLAIIGPVFAINMYFVLTPVFSSLTIFSGTIYTSALYAPQVVSPMMAGVSTSMLGLLNPQQYNPAFSLICMLAGMSVVKQASALLCNLLGVGDLTKESLDMAKKTAQTAVKVAAAAMTGGAAAAALGAAQAATSDAESGYSEAQAATADAKGQLDKAKEGGNQDEIAAAEKNLAEKEREEEKAKLTLDEAKENEKGYEKEKREADRNLTKTAISATTETLGLTNIDAVVEARQKGWDKDDGTIAAAKKGKGEGSKARKELEGKKRGERQLAIEEEERQEGITAANNAYVGLEKNHETGESLLGHAKTGAQTNATQLDTNLAREAGAAATRGSKMIDEIMKKLIGGFSLTSEEKAIVDKTKLTANSSASQIQSAKKYAAEHDGQYLDALAARHGAEKMAGREDEIREAMNKKKFNPNDNTTELKLSDGTVINAGDLRLLSSLGKSETASRTAAATAKGKVDAEVEKQLVEEEAAGIIAANKAQTAIDGMEVDRNALGDAVQQGIQESLDALKSAMKEAFSSGKLDVKGITEMRDSLQKAFSYMQKEKQNGTSDSDIIDVMKTLIDDLRKGLNRE